MLVKGNHSIELSVGDRVTISPSTKCTLFWLSSGEQVHVTAIKVPFYFVNKKYDGVMVQPESKEDFWSVDHVTHESMNPDAHLDPTPVEVTVLKPKKNLRAEMQAYIRNVFSQYMEQKEDIESFEEASDFDVPDEYEDMLVSPYEFTDMVQEELIQWQEEQDSQNEGDDSAESQGDGESGSEGDSADQEGDSGEGEGQQ